MGLLSGLSYRDVTRKRRAAGFEFDRTAKGSHKIWRNVLNGHRTTVPHHPGVLPPEGTVRAIIRQAGLSASEFINL